MNKHSAGMQSAIKLQLFRMLLCLPVNEAASMFVNMSEQHWRDLEAGLAPVPSQVLDKMESLYTWRCDQIVIMRSVLSMSPDAQVFEFWPSDLQRLFSDAGLPRRTPPDAQRDCQVQAAIDTSEAPRITSPLTQVTYSLRLSQPQESIALAAHAAADARLLYWFADHTLVGQGTPQTALQWRPERSGQYRIRVSDDQGRSTSRALQVEFLP